MRTGWADGPEFVTQCPIRPGQSYTYRFTIDGQEGTLWWHAHSSWLRATVYGALIIYPREGTSYTFAKPKRESTLLLGKNRLSSKNVLVYTELIRVKQDSDLRWVGLTEFLTICRRMVEYQSSRRYQRGSQNRRCPKHFWCIHHQRSTWWSLQLLQQRYDLQPSTEMNFYEAMRLLLVTMNYYGLIKASLFVMKTLLLYRWLWVKRSSYG